MIASVLFSLSILLVLHIEDIVVRVVSFLVYWSHHNNEPSGFQISAPMHLRTLRCLQTMGAVYFPFRSYISWLCDSNTTRRFNPGRTNLRMR